jgi:myosin V
MSALLVQDMTALTHLHEPGVLHNLSVRYAADRIYTLTGSILIAVNPFKRISHLTSQATMAVYQAQLIGVADNRRGSSGGGDKLPPHVYSTAVAAYQQMMRDGAGQAILVGQCLLMCCTFQLCEVQLWLPEDCLPAKRPSIKGQAWTQSLQITGESGAGKTETCKLIMRCLAQLGSNAGAKGSVLGRQQQLAPDGKVGNGSNIQRMNGSNHNADEQVPPVAMSRIERLVLQSNPVLEAFGNAKTSRNDNSSRFGKYVELRFCDPADAASGGGGRLVGAAIHTYLLERSRVVSLAPGERGFHAFYQVLVDWAGR